MELTHLKEKNYLYMRSRLRSPKGINIPHKIRAVSNPSHNSESLWVKRRFIDKILTNEGDSPEDVYFLKASLLDNPYLDHDSYIKQLNGLDEVERRQLLYGDWEITRSGDIFNENSLIKIPRSSLPLYRRKVIGFDMAGTSEAECTEKGKEADYTSGCVMSFYNGDYFIEEIIHGRWDANETVEIQINTAKKHGRSCKIVEEQERINSLV